MIGIIKKSEKLCIVNQKHSLIIVYLFYLLQSHFPPSGYNYPQKEMAQRKSWSREQDDFIRLKVETNKKLADKDKLKWGDIADHLNQAFTESHRSGKQCRERWHNQLDPEILHSEWSIEQERRLFELQMKLGNKWAEIASNMKGRTDNNVKNYFYSTLRKSLRKLNTFISLNRIELKAAKQFKQSSLSKLLAVADHKFDKKINVKKVTAQNEAVQIKNMLIEIIRLEATDPKSRTLFTGLVKRLQEWNKCCKKKKGKRKQQVEIGEDDDGEDVSEEEDMEEEENQGEQNNMSRSSALNRSRQEGERAGGERKVRGDRSRSRNHRQEMEKKLSNLSKNSIKSKTQKKPVPAKDEKKHKQQVNNNKLPQQIQQITKRQSSKQQQNSSSLSNSNIIDWSRSSLDLGKFQKKLSNSSLNQSSNLFKSFIIESHPQHPQPQPHQKSAQKESKVKITRKGSNMSFLDMIKEVSFQRRDSQLSSGFDDFLQDDNHNNNYFGIRMLKRESSRRELPLIKDQSFAGFGGLESSLRFEPQISKLRSWRKDSSNFQAEYRFENTGLN